MSETQRAVLEAWIGMGDRPTDAEMSLVTLERVREAIRAVLAELDRRRSFMQALSEVEPPREEGTMSETPQDVCKERDAWKERAWKQQARAEQAEAALRAVHKQFLYYAKRHQGDTGIICGEADIKADELARAALRDTAPEVKP